MQLQSSAKLSFKPAPPAHRVLRWKSCSLRTPCLLLVGLVIFSVSATQPRCFSLWAGGSASPPGPCKSEPCRTGWFLPPLSLAGARSPWEQRCPEGLPCPGSLWESRSGAGASARKLSSFFPGAKPRCKQDKPEEGVSSPLSLASGWPCSPKVPGGFAVGSWGKQGCKAQPKHPGSPCLAGYQCMGEAGGETQK